MRSILAGTSGGLGSVIIARFVDGFFGDIAAGIITGALIGAGVAFLLRPKGETQ